MEITVFDWPYYILVNGKLYIRSHRGLVEAFHNNPPLFADAAEAEQWLIDNDIRGNVQYSTISVRVGQRRR
jgi:hypothetical protein